MSDVIVKMKMSQQAAGAMYMKNIRLEDKVEELNRKLLQIGEYSCEENDKLYGDALHNINCVLSE